MRLSQLLHVMDRDEDICIDDMGKRIDENRIYAGNVRGIKRDDPINKMHVVCIFPSDNTLNVLVKSPDRVENDRPQDRIWKGYRCGK